jgi:hypothetical protein
MPPGLRASRSSRAKCLLTADRSSPLKGPRKNY